MLRSAADHYRAQQRLVAVTASAVRREWDSIGADFDAGWARVGPRIVTLMTAAQVGAARDGAAYVGQALEEQRVTVEPVAAVNVSRLVGAYGVDGQTLGDLGAVLYGAVVRARTAPAESLGDRLAAGRSWLDMATVTQVADAGRAATGVGIAARPGVGYVRMVHPGCCQRCAVLAGKSSRSIAFPRHPGCQCRAVPTGEHPQGDLVEAIEAKDVRDLTKAQRKAIADGADMNQVINSHRVYTSREGIHTPARSADGMTTTEGATRRGIAGGRLGAASKQRARRLTPEGVYRLASTHEEAIALLRAHGYLL